MQVNIKNEGLRIEVESALRAGMKLVSLAELDEMIDQLGYARDKSMRCTCIAKNLATGNTYPNVSFGVREKDTKRSAFHFESRRDENFKKLQEIRFDTFSVVRDQWLSL